MKYTILLLSILLIFSTGCVKKQELSKPADVWMKEGLMYFNDKDYQEAAAAFENAIMEAESPELAAKAQLFLGDSYFFMENYEEAIPSYNEFLHIYFESADAPKVMHRLGLSYFNQLGTIDRDQSKTELALNSFLKLKIDYPVYSKELKLDSKIKEIRDMLAEKDLYIARFYFRINEYNAGEFQLRHFLDNYKDTAYYPEAAFMLSQYLFHQEGREEEAIEYLNELIGKCSNPKMLKKITKLLARYKKENKELKYR